MIFRKLCAALLLVLVVTPWTAPFQTCIGSVPASKTATAIIVAPSLAGVGSPVGPVATRFRYVRSALVLRTGMSTAAPVPALNGVSPQSQPDSGTLAHLGLLVPLRV